MAPPRFRVAPVRQFRVLNSQGVPHNATLITLRFRNPKKKHFSARDGVITFNGKEYMRGTHALWNLDLNDDQTLAFHQQLTGTSGNSALTVNVNEYRQYRLNRRIWMVEE